ncbi:unnamed protein product [Cylindrotheca closterium]|uniref:Amino acid transporter transmembrane domain-containing protein n=1 Tax=Cylindrotheca closterium TaxID=2856 RepID=A0AAD2G1W6_9STRA|nr:unnamed protein product [Cylindrotheca closterium]
MEDSESLLPPLQHAHTYVAGEDGSRLKKVARGFGLTNTEARIPQPNVRVLPLALKLLWSDDTLERARMHSVGTLADNERLDDYGNVHRTMTVRRRRRRRGEGLVPLGHVKPDYGGDLSNLFEHPSKIDEGDEEDEDDDDDDDEESVDETIDVEVGGSITAAVFGIIKGTIGGAVLFLPRGFQMAGYALAIPIMILSTASYLYSANRLLECWRVEKAKAAMIDEIRALLLEGSPKMYGSTKAGEELKQQPSEGGKLLSYPELARRAFGSGAFCVELGIATMQFGVCLTYLIFVPQNLYEATHQLFGWEMSKTVFLVCMVLMEVPLAWIRDIRRLAFFNFIATLLVAYGLFSCVVLAFMEIAKDPELTYLDRLADLPPTNPDTWILFIGTAFFAFEGCITLIVPLQGAVSREEDKQRFPKVNQTVTSSIVAFYIFFALTCWAAFGSNIKTALTASLPPGPYATSVQLAYSLAILFTFPLQAFPAMEVVFHYTAHGAIKTDPSVRKKLSIQATLIVCCLGVVAYLAIDYLGNVVSLLGSLVGIPIALVFPPIMHNILVRDLSTFTKVLNYSVATLGVVIIGVTTYITILQWDKGAG